MHFIPDQTQTRPSGPSPLDFTDNNLLSVKKWKFIKYGHKMLELRTKCMRFKNINSCNNTQSNISEWLKAVGWRKKRQRWNLDLAKRVVNLSFSSWLSPMTKLVLCFPYFANIYIIYDQHIYIINGAAIDYNRWDLVPKARNVQFKSVTDLVSKLILKCPHGE